MSSARKTITVLELTKLIKAALESEPVFMQVSVVGEVSQPTVSSLGHAYFNLKEKDALIKCVWFGHGRKKLPFNDGDQVVATGKITVYMPRGEYQLSVSEVVPKGIGALAAEFEKIKARLKGEGLFDEERKIPIPKLPHRIAIVTSPTTAALQDMLNIHDKNAPHVELKLFSTIMQGDTAPPKIIAALEAAQNDPRPFDLVIVARGGGSIEDLWCFNDESLARAVANCTIPVVSGVGHEIDFTICDFASDLRAPTPTAAMEIATGNWPVVLADYERLSRQAIELAARRIRNIEADFARLADLRAVRALTARIEDAERTLDDAAGAASALPVRIENLRAEAGRALDHRTIAAIVSSAARRETDLSAAAQLLARGINEKLGALESLFSENRSAIFAGDLEKQLKRGFSVVTRRANSEVITGADGVKPGEEIRVRAHRGAYFAIAGEPDLTGASDVIDEKER